MKRHSVFRMFFIACAMTLTQCTDEYGEDMNPPQAPSDAPFAELIEQGVTRYLGSYSPMLATQDGNDTTYHFGGGDGPLCLQGDQYNVVVRNNGAEDLLIFLMGGGACWSDLCLANTIAEAEIPRTGLLDQSNGLNPLRHWNVVFLPYCDGSLFAGDTDLDVTDDGNIDRHHRGLKNLSAGLDTAVSNFPAPRRILLTGASAGGFGTSYAIPLVRHLYPETPIYVVNDSGVGIFPQLAKAFGEWGANRFIPSSCVNCHSENGNLKGYHRWILNEDRNIFLSLMSYTKDSVIAETYTGLGLEEFERQLRTDLCGIDGDKPSRLQCFLADDEQHVFVLGDLNVDVQGMTVAKWVTAMVTESAEWVTLADESDMLSDDQGLLRRRNQIYR